MPVLMKQDEEAFVYYLDAVKQPGYGQNFLKNDPEGFYWAMQFFYLGNEKDQ